MTKYSLPDDLGYVDVYDKKYTIIQRASGEMFFLRHGEPWEFANNSDWIHAGMILALAQDLQEARVVLQEMRDALLLALDDSIRGNASAGRKILEADSHAMGLLK